MKKSLFISFFFICSICHASNLEFSQVIVIDGSVAFSQTVPTGKVWKIESATGAAGAAWVRIYINNLVAILYGTIGSNTSGAGAVSYMPVWLPSGTGIANWGNANCGLLSIIEYNIVP